MRLDGGWTSLTLGSSVSSTRLSGTLSDWATLSSPSRGCVFWKRKVDEENFHQSNVSYFCILQDSTKAWNRGHMFTHLCSLWLREWVQPRFQIWDNKAILAYTGWPFTLSPTSHWYQHKSSVLVWGACTKPQPLLWWQWEVGNSVNGHPVDPRHFLHVKIRCSTHDLINRRQW